MRDLATKVLEQIEKIVTSANDADASLEMLVNYSRENCGRIYIQTVDDFDNVLECSFSFQSRYAVFDFGCGEIQVDYARPETVKRVLECFRTAIAMHAKERHRGPIFVAK